MAEVLGDLHDGVGRNPARDADDQRVELLGGQTLDGVLDLRFLVIVGDGIDRNEIQSLCFESRLRRFAFPDDDLNRSIDFSESYETDFSHCYSLSFLSFRRYQTGG